MARISYGVAQPDELVELGNLAFRAKASWGYDDAFMAACRHELQVSADDLDPATAWHQVARIDGVPAGFAIVSFEQAPLAELEALFIDPGWQRRGIGRDLMQRAALAASGRRCDALLIQSDPFAADFYRALGAVLVGTRESDSLAGRMLPLLRLSVDE